MSRKLFGAVLAVAIASAVPAAAQVAPPIPRPGTMAIPSGNDKLYDAGEAAADGVARGVRAVKDKFGAKAPLVDPLGGLLEGTTVVVRKGLPPAAADGATDTDVADVADNANVSEATVTHIEKARTQLTLRFDDGTKTNLQFAGSASSDKANANSGAAADVLSLTYTDDTGRKATRVFTKIS
jgi:opacity protein-like surface antigen